ncbi:MAG: PA2169 family four-helix-bundle protein [Cytophagaceae bacterium]|nr:PA2169 family four-helix-bundle protein [Cytophagaceae bacterium]
MAQNQDIVDSLNDLVQINNDRIRGYQSSVDNVQDAELADLFRHMIVQSQKFRSELADHIVRLDGKAVEEATSTDLSSKFHRAWLDIKASIFDNKKATVLSSVEFGEGAAVDAYEEALDDDDLPSHVKDVVQNQLTELRTALDKVKALHEAAD